MSKIRVGAVLLLFAACSTESTSRDEVAGTWRGGSHEIHLRADGSYDAYLTADDRCRDDATLAACMPKQHWDRRGDKVLFWPAFVVSNQRGAGSFLGMFNMYDKPRRPDAPPCECKVQEEPEVFELRDANTMALGKEIAVRVR